MDAAHHPLEALFPEGRIVRHARFLVLKLAIKRESLDFLTLTRGQCHALFSPA